MKAKLTAKSVEALKPPERKRFEVRDTTFPGLAIRVSNTGAKVWYLCTRVDGRARKIKIGDYPVLSLADARERAYALKRDIQLGTFETEKAPTLGKVIANFIELYAKQHTRDWQGTVRILTKFDKLKRKPINEITRRDVVNILDQIVVSGTPVRANRALAAIKKLMSWCVDRGMIDNNPIAGLKAPTKEIARDRVLTEDELIACWHGAEADGHPFDAFVKMLILTGQRRGEVAGMRWSEVDLERGLWSLPATRVKNATSHTVPLASLAICILRSTPRFLGSDFVFTTTGKSAISGFGRLKRRLDEAVGDDWRLHDIRRTVATNMAILGVQPHIIEAVLNHKSGIVSGVAATYNRHAYRDEKRAALEMWSEYVQTIAGRFVGSTVKEPDEDLAASTCARQF